MNDSKLFEGTAYYYVKYRPQYPREFFDFVVRHFKLDGTGRLLDLGCGPGTIAVPMSKFFEEVVGIDPEGEMLDEAKKQAEISKARNITWLQDKGENMSDALGLFRLATMGFSFHWMEQERALNKVYEHLEKNGGLVIVSNAIQSWCDGFTESSEEWKEIRRKLIQKYLGKKRRAGDKLYEKPQERFAEFLDRSPFRGYQKWVHEYDYTWTIESIVGHLYSTSYASRRLFGNRIGGFERELREALLQLEPEGIFKEHISFEALIAQK